jgi:hypothetical protein
MERDARKKMVNVIKQALSKRSYTPPQQMAGPQAGGMEGIMNPDAIQQMMQMMGGGGGMPGGMPMDPNQGGMPPQGMPMDPNQGMPPDQGQGQGQQGPPPDQGQGQGQGGNPMDDMISDLYTRISSLENALQGLTQKIDSLTGGQSAPPEGQPQEQMAGGQQEQGGQQMTPDMLLQTANQLGGQMGLPPMSPEMMTQLMSQMGQLGQMGQGAPQMPPKQGSKKTRNIDEILKRLTEGI